MILPAPDRRMGRIRAGAGFTLVELLLAVALMSSMLVVTYNAVNHAIQVRAAVDERAELIRAAYGFLDRLERELTAVYSDAATGPVIRGPGGTQGARQGAGDAVPPAVGATRASSTIFLGLSHEERLPRDGLAFSCLCREVWTYGLVDTTRIPHTVIAYDFVYDRELDLTVLMRREDGTLDRTPEEGGYSDPVWTSIRGLNFRYLDPVDKQWKDTWDASQRTEYPLPRAVEATIWLADPELDGVEVDAAIVIGRVFELPAAVPQ